MHPEWLPFKHCCTMCVISPLQAHTDPSMELVLSAQPTNTGVFASPALKSSSTATCISIATAAPHSQARRCDTAPFSRQTPPTDSARASARYSPHAHGDVAHHRHIHEYTCTLPLVSAAATAVALSPAKTPPAHGPWWIPAWARRAATERLACALRRRSGRLYRARAAATAKEQILE